MALTRRYPRTAVRKIIKGHTDKHAGKEVDALMYLNYTLFLQQLMKRATRKSREAGTKRVEARNIRKVTDTTLKAFKG